MAFKLKFLAGAAVVCAACAVVCSAVYVATQTAVSANASASGVNDARRYLDIEVVGPQGDGESISPMQINCKIDCAALASGGCTGSARLNLLISYAPGAFGQELAEGAAEVLSSAVCTATFTLDGVESACVVDSTVSNDGLALFLPFENRDSGECTVCVSITFGSGAYGVFSAAGEGLFVVSGHVVSI